MSGEGIPRICSRTARSFWSWWSYVAQAVSARPAQHSQTFQARWFCKRRGFLGAEDLHHDCHNTVPVFKRRDFDAVLCRALLAIHPKVQVWNGARFRIRTTSSSLSADHHDPRPRSLYAFLFFRLMRAERRLIVGVLPPQRSPSLNHFPSHRPPPLSLLATFTSSRRQSY